MSLVVIGGTVLDVQAQPHDADLQRGSSVPGQVAQVPGGVGRNIAEAAHHLMQHHKQQEQQRMLLNQSVKLISVIGRDAAADALLANFKQHGMSTAGVIQSSTATTPCVVAILDRGGEVAACVADVAAPAVELTPAVVQQHVSDIQSAGLLILDANLQAATLVSAAQLAAAAGVPVLFEPVSVPKAVRCVPVLKWLTYITPNANELLAIAAAVDQHMGQTSSILQQHIAKIDSLQSPQQQLAQLVPAATAVLQQGLKHIILTMGSQGAALLTLQQNQQQQQQQPFSTTTPDHHTRHLSSSSNSSSSSKGRQQLVAHHIPAAPADVVVNLSGAGDTLTGGFAAAMLRGATPHEALAVGVAAARHAVECHLNVPGPMQGLVYDKVLQQAQQLLAQMRVWQFPIAASL